MQMIIDRSTAQESQDTIEWFLQQIESYDRFLVAKGEPEEKVYSDIHKAGIWKARDVLAHLQAALGNAPLPETVIEYTRSGGHQPPRIR